MAARKKAPKVNVESCVADLRADAHDVLVRPVITEKTMAQNVDNKYTFLVALKANKIEIRLAVEKIFGVKVTKVTTVRCMGKSRRRGRLVGKQPDFKKAYVTLKEGDVIEVAGAPLFER